MDWQARDRLYHLERAIAMMYAEALDAPGITIPENVAWMLGVLHAWDQVRTLIETGQVKHFPYERDEVLR